MPNNFILKRPVVSSSTFNLMYENCKNFSFNHAVLIVVPKLNSTRRRLAVFAVKISALITHLGTP